MSNVISRMRLIFWSIKPIPLVKKRNVPQLQDHHLKSSKIIK